MGRGEAGGRNDCFDGLLMGLRLPILHGMNHLFVGNPFDVLRVKSFLLVKATGLSLGLLVLATGCASPGVNAYSFNVHTRSPMISASTAMITSNVLRTRRRRRPGAEMVG